MAIETKTSIFSKQNTFLQGNDIVIKFIKANDNNVVKYQYRLLYSRLYTANESSAPGLTDQTAEFVTSWIDTDVSSIGNDSSQLETIIPLPRYSYDIAFQVQVRAYDEADNLYSAKLLTTNTAYAFQHQNPSFALLPINIDANKSATATVRITDLGFIKPADTVNSDNYISAVTAALGGNDSIQLKISILKQGDNAFQEYQIINLSPDIIFASSSSPYVCLFEFAELEEGIYYASLELINQGTQVMIWTDQQESAAVRAVIQLPPFQMYPGGVAVNIPEIKKGSKDRKEMAGAIINSNPYTPDSLPHYSLELRDQPPGTSNRTTQIPSIKFTSKDYSGIMSLEEVKETPVFSFDKALAIKDGDNTLVISFENGVIQFTVINKNGEVTEVPLVMGGNVI